MPEKIFARIIEQNGVLRISIDYKIAQFLGLKKGDMVTAWIDKTDVKPNEQHE